MKAGSGRGLALLGFLVAGLPAAGLEAPLSRLELPAALEVWNETAPAPQTGEETGAPHLFVSVRDLAEDAPLADWCLTARATAPESPLERLLVGPRGDYHRFEGSKVPVDLEILIEDVELRYAMGTRRPSGTDGRSFPFLEICPVGFGGRGGEEWFRDVLYLRNRHGADLVLGFYSGALPEEERTLLAERYRYPADAPDPAGLLVVDAGDAGQALILHTATDPEEIIRLRKEILP